VGTHGFDVIIGSDQVEKDGEESALVISIPLPSLARFFRSSSVPQNAAAYALLYSSPCCGILVRGTVPGEAAASSNRHHCSALSVVFGTGL
jgi:hypothetical protein